MPHPVAVVQHEPSVPPGSIAGVLGRTGIDYFVVEAWRDPLWPELEDLGGLVVMGGTMNVDETDAHPFLKTSRDLMAAALERETPVLGVCLGSQMMSRVLGGEVFRAEPRNAFFSSLDIPGETPDDVVEPFADGTPVLQFHEDTFTLPEGATPLARSSASGLLQGFRYGANAYAFQFHFEVDEAILRGWCRNIGDRAMSEEWGIASDDLLAQGRRHLEAQGRAGEDLVERFLGRAGLVHAP